MDAPITHLSLGISPRYNREISQRSGDRTSLRRGLPPSVITWRKMNSICLPVCKHGKTDDRLKCENIAAKGSTFANESTAQ